MVDIGDLENRPHDQERWEGHDYYIHSTIADILRSGFANGLGFLASIFALQALSYELEFVVFPLHDLWKRLGIVSLSIGIGFLWRRMWVKRMYELENMWFNLGYHHVNKCDDTIDD